ncbi:M50 family metallopeptidase [Sphingomonas lacunae]|uniref:M50 family metallopeptidase n=1 Tax=Sphingomonas lacunae TaxID=2698828 RepID=A0A6M4AWT4_9SPHN|nr:M50 family metallopeptidase [Sphingomonas lacunae]QJQ32509.1 M50 family metallopeptidase [Sphingomonas lacunae]
MNWLKRLLRPLATLVSIIASFMFVGAAHDWLPYWSTLAIFGMILLIITFVIFVHELGHALAFRWQGGTVDEFAVLFLAWRRSRQGKPGGMGWARRMGADIGGYVIGHFGATIRTRRKAIWVAAGGPLANGLLTILCLLAAWSINAMTAPDMPSSSATGLEIVAGSPPETADLGQLPDADEVQQIFDQVERIQKLEAAQAILVLIGLNSLMTGLLNLIPFSGSDGYAILRHWLQRRGRDG